MFDILDLNRDGFLAQAEIERICIATRNINEGAVYTQTAEFNTFEKNGKEEAEKLMKKLDSSNEGKVSKEKFITAMFNEPEFEVLQKRFNVDESETKYGYEYTDPGSVQVALGDLLKD